MVLVCLCIIDMAENIDIQRQIELAWSKLAQAVVDRDMGALTKYFFWLRKLLKLQIIRYD